MWPSLFLSASLICTGAAFKKTKRLISWCGRKSYEGRFQATAMCANLGFLFTQHWSDWNNASVKGDTNNSMGSEMAFLY